VRQSGQLKQAQKDLEKLQKQLLQEKEEKKLENKIREGYQNIITSLNDKLVGKDNELKEIKLAKEKTREEKKELTQKNKSLLDMKNDLESQLEQEIIEKTALMQEKELLTTEKQEAEAKLNQELEKVLSELEKKTQNNQQIKAEINKLKKTKKTTIREGIEDTLTFLLGLYSLNKK